MAKKKPAGKKPVKKAAAKAVAPQQPGKKKNLEGQAWERGEAVDTAADESE